MESPCPEHSAISAAGGNRRDLGSMLLQAIDLGATSVFAISGLTQGVRHRLDPFGVLVVARASGVGLLGFVVSNQTVTRDLLICSFRWPCGRNSTGPAFTDRQGVQ